MKIFCELNEAEKRVVQEFENEKYYVTAVGKMDDIKLIALESNYYRNQTVSPSMPIFKLDGATWNDTDAGGYEGGNQKIRSNLFLAYEIRSELSAN